MKRLLLIALLFVLAEQLNAQQVAPDTAKTHFMLTTGLDLSGAVNGKFGFASPTFSFQFASKLKHNLELTYGFDLSSYRFIDDPKSYWTKTSGSSASLPQWHEVHYQNHYKSRYWGLPIQLAYSPNKRKWAPYFSLGLIPSYNFTKWRLTDYAYSANPETWHASNGSDFTLFATAQSGFIRKGKNSDLRILLSANQFLFATEQVDRKPYAVGIDIGMRRVIHGKKNKPQSLDSENADSLVIRPQTGNLRRNGNHQCYVEVFGPGYFYSINYEGRMTSTRLFAMYGRIGMMLWPSDNSSFILPQAIPFSLTFTLGRRSNVEFGAAISLSPTQLFDGLVFSPILGYRMEGNNQFVFRFFASALVFVEQSNTYPWAGLSMGKRFGKVK